MASRATRAAERLDQDRAKLTLVPAGPEPAPPARTAGDVARQAARDALPPHQQAEYDRLTTAGSRHVTALAGARKLPDPAAEPTSIEQAAADLFAAMAAGQVGAAAPPVTVAAASGEPGSKPAVAPPAPKPVLKPAAAADLAEIGKLNPAKASAPKPAKVKAAPVPVRPADPNTPASAYDRHIGTVTATGLDGKEHTYDCEHGSRNGHMDVATAETCARRLLRNHPSGQPGTRVHPVHRDRNGAKIAVPA